MDKSIINWISATTLLITLLTFSYIGTIKEATASEEENSSQFFTFILNDIKGNPIPFEQFKGKVTLLVNTASQCSLTETQLKALKRLHDILSHGNKFNVIAFPCNEFGEQEPWENVEIEEYYRGHFHIEFIVLQKGSVAEDPLWKWVKENSVAPSDNFHKYLIDGTGKIVNNWSGDVLVETIFDEVQALINTISDNNENVNVNSKENVQNKEEL